MTRLSENTQVTLAKMSQYTAYQVEQRFEAYRRALEELDSLQRSERFFEQEYDKEDKDMHLSNVRQMIAQMDGMIAGLSQPKSIGVLAREHLEMTTDMLAIMVNDLRSYLILDRMITDSGIISLCPLIIATYPSLTLEEIAVCFAQAKKGFYGEDFQRMDGSTIMKWLRLYMEDKQERNMNKQLTMEVQYKSGKDVGRTEVGVSMREGLNRAHAAMEIAKVRLK